MSSVQLRLVVVTGLVLAFAGAGCDQEQERSVVGLDQTETTGFVDVDDGGGLPDAADDPNRGFGECVPRDLAYWRAAAVWPLETLELGDRVYIESELRAILAMDASDDISIELAQEYIVTWLNYCAGCAVSDDVQDAMDDCGRWLGETPDLCGEEGTVELPYCQPDEGPLAESAFRCFERLRLYNTNGREC
jgi:hypothetical protein